MTLLPVGKLCRFYLFCVYLARAAAWILFYAGLGSSVSVSAQEASPEIDQVLAAVVGVDSQIPDSARTAATLGTERSGSGVVIDSNGLVVTIGYIILEAISARITLADGSTVPAKILAYDHDTGLGLLRALQPVTVKPMAFGHPDELKKGDRVLIVSQRSSRAVHAATVVSRRTFAGYWEYLLEDAIFTSPPHPEFAGAALIGPAGNLLGIGSLIVGDAVAGEEPVPGNMFVPIDRLEPLRGDLLAPGKTLQPAHPWLGLYTEEYRGHLFINRLADDGPAAAAGLKPGEIIAQVAGQPVTSLIDFYRKIWALGNAGVEVPLTVLRAGRLAEISVISTDRHDWLHLNPSF